MPKEQDKERYLSARTASPGELVRSVMPSPGSVSCFRGTSENEEHAQSVIPKFRERFRAETAYIECHTSIHTPTTDMHTYIHRNTRQTYIPTPTVDTQTQVHRRHTYIHREWTRYLYSPYKMHIFCCHPPTQAHSQFALLHFTSPALRCGNRDGKSGCCWVQHRETSQRSCHRRQATKRKRKYGDRCLDRLLYAEE